mgnify:CR=1 FL=1
MANINIKKLVTFFHISLLLNIFYNIELFLLYHIKWNCNINEIAKISACVRTHAMLAISISPIIPTR